jgi:hypothetical protein
MRAFTEQMTELANSQESENRKFREHVMNEYVEFFRSKTRFSRQWKKHQTDTENMINKAKIEMQGQESKVIQLQQIQPLILECLCLMNSYQQADLNARMHLSEHVKL